MNMDYEKRYKDALEKARKLYEQGTITESLNYVFPELKEPNDERIRKALIGLLKFGFKDGSAIAPGANITKEDALAWLEKQERR